MDRNFGGVIWTNHALDRLRERGIKQGDAWATFQRPDQSYKGDLHKNEKGYRYYKQYGDQVIEVVANQNDKKEWVIVTVWSRPVWEYQKMYPNLAKKKNESLLVKILKMLLGMK